MFDWQRFLDQRNVPYVTQGANVARGHVSVKCPFCIDDPSEHMSIHLGGAGWRCWRNHAHRGKAPQKLVAALLGCTWQQAQQIVGGAVFIPEDFSEQVNAALVPEKETARTRPLEMPDSFRAFNGQWSSRPFIQYLRDRDFAEKHLSTRDGIASVTRRFGLRYCTQGSYKGRIIFPIRANGELVGWTGRTIYKSETLRYRVLSDNPEKAEREGFPPARGPNTNYLLWWDKLKKTDADVLTLVEGPFDALKVWILGAPIGVVSTCFFTAEPSAMQIELLHQIVPRFKRTVLLLDRGTFATSIRISNQLSGLGIETVQLDQKFKDPGTFKTQKDLASHIFPSSY